MTVCYWEKPWRSALGGLWYDVLMMSWSPHWSRHSECSIRGGISGVAPSCYHMLSSVTPVYRLKFTRNKLIFIGELLVVLLRHAVGKIISLQYQITHCDDEFSDLRVILSPFVIFNAVLYCFQPSWRFLLELVWISGIVCASECLCGYAL